MVQRRVGGSPAFLFLFFFGSWKLMPTYRKIVDQNLKEGFLSSCLFYFYIHINQTINQMAKRKSPKMILAGKKAAETRRKNREMREMKFTTRAKKAWDTRRENEKNGVGYNFTNVDGVEKIKSRNQKVDLYKNSGITSGRLLLLPSQTCADIFLINEKIPNNKFKFVGCEIDKKAFRLADKKRIANNLNLTLYKLGVENVVDGLIQYVGEDALAHADIDLCQTFTKYKSVIEKIVDNKLVQKGGIVSFTFAARDVNVKKTALEILKKTAFNQLAYKVEKDKINNNFALPVINKWLTKLCKKGYKVVIEPYTYSDSKRGNHMIHGSIQRIA